MTILRRISSELADAFSRWDIQETLRGEARHHKCFDVLVTGKQNTLAILFLCIYYEVLLANYVNAVSLKSHNAGKL